MALRLYSEFHSSTDKLFKVEIHDEDFSGTAEAFTVASDGFTLNYKRRNRRYSKPYYWL